MCGVSQRQDVHEKPLVRALLLVYHVQGANRSSAADTVACRSAMFEFRDRLRVLQERDVLREEWPGQRDRCGDQGFRWDDHVVLRVDQQRPLDAILVLR